MSSGTGDLRSVKFAFVPSFVRIAGPPQDVISWVRDLERVEWGGGKSRDYKRDVSLRHMVALN